ncbi:hypothetical protein MSPP1_001187 [Malassezia sp. CBS 17886]|nr:hypothetical protein MSPP1_001187 [Malassezia sp. CBS 17886]
MARPMLPLGFASAPLDVLNATGVPDVVHAVPGVHAGARAGRAVGDAGASARHGTTCPLAVLGADAFLLVRVLAPGHELEVRVVGGAAAFEAPPTRIVFPAPLIASVGAVEDAAGDAVFILAVSHAGMLFRVTLALAALLRGEPPGARWVHEHRVAALVDEALEPASVHVVDAGLLLVACTDGTLVRLQQPVDAHGVFSGAWLESTMRPTSFLSGVSRLFTRSVPPSPAGKRGALPPAASPLQTVAVATHLREHDAALAFCVCRDRKLRVWNLATETCVRTLALPASYTSAATSADDDGDVLDGASTPLVALLYGAHGGYPLHVLVHVPAPLPGGAFVAAYGVELEESSSWSGGVGEITLVWGKACDVRTQAPDVELRDMALTHDEHTASAHVWLLWHAGGAPLLQSTRLFAEPGDRASQALVRGGDGAEPWATVRPFAQVEPLRGPVFERALAAVPAVHDAAQFFLARLASFNGTTLVAALRAFAAAHPHAALSDQDAAELARPAQRVRVLERVAVAVAAACAPHDAGAHVVRRTWLQFVHLVEQADRSAHWPLGLCVLRAQPPIVVARHALGVLVQRGAGVWLGDLAGKLATAAQHPERASSRAVGEAASAEYARVANALAAVPAYAERAEGGAYALVRMGGVALLALAALAAELAHALQERAERVACALRTGAPQTACAAARRHVPDAVFARVRAYVADAGADELPRRLTLLTDLFACADGVPSPARAPPCPALYAAAAASAASEQLRVQEASLTGVLLLLAVLLDGSGAESRAPLEHMFARALGAWRTAHALHATTQLSAVRERDPEVLPVAPKRAPAVHLLHLLAQCGVLVCRLHRDDDACFLLQLGGTFAAPPALLHAALALVQGGFPSALRPLLADFEGDAARTYLLAVADMQLGRCELAARALPEVCAVLQEGGKSGALDGGAAGAARTRLLGVLPDAVSDAGAAGSAAQVAAFWHAAAARLEAAGATALALTAYARALDAAPAPSADVYSRVFRLQESLGAYETAAATLLAIPYEDLREVCLQSLVTALCEADAVSTLLRINFLELQTHVERTLSFKARNAAPHTRPDYFHILYAYHISRGDYKSAAASMYQCARRLHAVALATHDAGASRALAVRQAQSYLASINALALLPRSHAWFAHALAEEGGGFAAAAAAPVPAPKALPGGVTHHLPGAAHALAIVQLADVRREYAELLARLELVRLYPELANPSAPLRAEDAVNLFLASDDFDTAFATARQLAVDQSNVFDALTRRCVVLGRADAARRAALGGAERAERAEDAEGGGAALAALRLHDADEGERGASFLQRSARTADWPGAPSERAWRLVRVHADAADGAEAATRYHTAIANVLVASGAWDLAPVWLQDWFRAHGPDLLLHVFMRHGRLLPALRYGTAMLDEAAKTARTTEEQPRVWLAYTLLESLLAAAAARGTEGDESADVREAADALRARLQARIDTLRTRAAPRRPRRSTGAADEGAAPPAAPLPRT